MMKQKQSLINLSRNRSIHTQNQSLRLMGQTITGLSEALTQLTQRIEFIPQQVRQLGTKVDNLGESVSHPRIRDLLGRFLDLYDLVVQMQRNTPSTDSANASNYQVLHDQILQILKLNGIYPIHELQGFDPRIHKAIDTEICLNAEEDGRIARICRTGFRTDQAILRYAEVVVKRWSKKENKEVDNE